MGSTIEQAWWKEAVVYQVYPLSFQDSNGDGIGDLPGIISRLDYLKMLGINVIWLSPIFPSPNDDNGYDISDYQAIMAEFGTMADFDRLLEEAHARGIRILLDLVLNHTSDEHPWFQESRQSRDNPKSDWYIWRDGKAGGPPNNWESIFSGSAWRYYPERDQYCLHLFSARQPDLNWENPEVREALYAMIRWWLDKGVDGFRIDAITHIRKVPGMPDLPNPKGLSVVPSSAGHRNVEGIQEYVADLCTNTFARYKDVMTVGEAAGVDIHDAPNWVAADQQKFNMIFQFEQLKLWGSDVDADLDLPALKKTLTRWQKGLEGQGWNALFVENHDIARIVSTWGDAENYWRESATAIAALYFLMQGTPFIYQGQELGMTNFPFERLDQFDDVAVQNFAAARLEEGWTEAEILDHIRNSARDNARTPMQWDNTANGGFTDGEPWLPTNPNYKTLNAARQARDPDSILNFYRELIRLRAASPALMHGTYDLVLEDHPQVYAYTRTLDNEQFLVVSNLSGEVADISACEVALTDAEQLLGNQGDNGEQLTLRPWEARVLSCSS
ncbi:MAG: alpha-glucosidase [Natronospirillum sp.]|uniref:glycoside hydrolase family 13 protein n=1 Tax=Natronospirillum sp. TaxID=2812955 RepID=UPI0025CDC292|nr:alpha-glucosidase [Natronospirillum sp.]MCH8551244.1 alpha-glucosidase [Natronospirillum sp.]